MRATGHALSPLRGMGSADAGRFEAPVPASGGSSSAVRCRGASMERNSQSGSVLVAVLSSTLALAGMVGGLVTAELARSRRAVEEADLDRAFLLAESGVDTVQALLNAGVWTSTSSVDWSTDGVDNDGDG